MSDQDLQSFLASFSAQAQGVDAAAPAAAAEANSLALAPPSSNVDLDASFGGGSELQPVCTPITRMASEFSSFSSGRLISCNDSYICYSIKGNLVRVIHFVNVTRTKLPAHPAALVDMEFAGKGSDLLASLDAEGTLRIRRIFEEEGECKFNNELDAK